MVIRVWLFRLRLPRVWLFGCGRDGRMFRRVLSGCVGPVAWCCDRSELVRFGAEEEEGADVMIACFGFLFVPIVDGFL